MFASILLSRATLFCIFILLLSIPCLGQAYSEKTTHPALTNEIVSFYNATYLDDRISESEREWMIEGSRLEDTWPRWINHLYDPVYKSGWTGRNTGFVHEKIVRTVSTLFLSSSLPLSALDWMRNQQAQEGYGRYGGNHTWQKGLEEASQKDHRAAYITLGHLLHLLEDLGVPDHTRDDTHAHAAYFLTGDIGSPYEIYTEKWNRNNFRMAAQLAVEGIRPPENHSPEDFMIAMARYSNRYFFSKDTINDARYTMPRVMAEKDNIAYGQDESNREFPLVRRVKVVGKDGKLVSVYRMFVSDDEAVIFDAYFARLSRQVIVNGAGLVRLFRNQTRASRVPSGKKSVSQVFSILGEGKKVLDAGKSVFRAFLEVGNRTYAVLKRGIYNFGAQQNILPQKSTSAPSLEHSVPKILPDKSGPSHSIGSSQPLPVKPLSSIPIPFPSTKQAFSDPATESNVVPHPKLPKPNKDKPAPPSFCPLKPTQASNKQILLNEVAWMGTPSSSADEWIELKNTTPKDLDLEGWQLLSLSGKIRFIFSQTDSKVRTARIAANSLYLLERTDDSSVPHVAADGLYIGGLSNTDPQEGLRLYDAACRLIDEVRANAGNQRAEWPAGDAATRQTMERSGNSLEWHTSAKVGGTPKAPNSTGRPNPPLSLNISRPTSTTSVPNSTSTTLTALEKSSAMPLASSSVVISEIQVSGTNAGDEFIELYNPHSVNVDLSTGSIQYTSGSGIGAVSKKNFTSNAVIPAYGYFLIGRGVDSTLLDGYQGSVPADMMHRSFSLSGDEAGAIVYLVRATDLISGIDDPSIVDVASYTNMVPSPHMSLERKAFAGNLCLSPLPEAPGALLGNGCQGNTSAAWVTRSIAEPQNAHSLPEPRVQPSPSATSTAPANIFLRNIAAHSFSFPTSSIDFGAVLDFHEAPWYVIVPYLNEEPWGESAITTQNQLSLLHPSGLKVDYPGCHGDRTISEIIILPTSVNRCEAGGPLSSAYSFDLTDEDDRFHAHIAKQDGSSFQAGDYLRFALYSYAGGQAGIQTFTLSAIDPTHYPLASVATTLAPPTSPGPVTVEWDTLHHVAIIKWERSMDIDTPDIQLIYKITVTAAGVPVWEEVTKSLTTTAPLLPGEEYEIQVIAQDEFGLFSEATTFEWFAPREILPPSQTARDEVVGFTDGGKQSFKTASALSITSLALWGASSGAFCCSLVSVEIYKDREGQPAELMQKSETISVAQNMGDHELRFSFEEVVEMEAGTYWIIPRTDEARNTLRVYGSSGDAYIDGSWSQNTSRDAYFRLGSF